jgi:hypothetical protein
MTSTPLPCFTAQTARSGGAQHLQRSRALIAAYRSWGGSVHANELPALFSGTVHDGASSLIRWLLSGELVSFRIGACWHVPLFQFSWVRPGLCPDVSRVVEELRARFDGTEVAEWFVRPNPRLEWRWPVAVLDRERDEVLRAARADNAG